jgi:small subunit ribosomal protein S16
VLRIRLRRVGKKKQAMYRIVVADSRAPRDGAFVEVLGQYYPLNNPSTIELDEERARHWLGRGARPSDRVSKLLAIKGLAEVPPKLKKRIELGAQRAKDAESQKVKAKAETAKAEAEAPPAAASAAEPAAETPAPEPAEPEAAGAEEVQAEA